MKEVKKQKMSKIIFSFAVIVIVTVSIAILVASINVLNNGDRILFIIGLLQFVLLVALIRTIIDLHLNSYDKLIHDTEEMDGSQPAP